MVYIYNYWEIQSSGDTLLSFTQAKCPHLALDQILNSCKESIISCCIGGLDRFGIGLDLVTPHHAHSPRHRRTHQLIHVWCVRTRQ